MLSFVLLFLLNHRIYLKGFLFKKILEFILLTCPNVNEPTYLQIKEL
jgi:hypothetical protein